MPQSLHVLPCSCCSLRRKARRRPASFAGRFWRLHTKVCPGWNAYRQAVLAVRSERLAKAHAP